MRPIGENRVSRPSDGVTQAQAAEVLGVHPTTVARLVRAGELTAYGSPHARRRLSRAEVEALALSRHPSRGKHRRDGDGYWVGRAEAARILGVTPGRVSQLVKAERIPHERAADGSRVFRRQQLEVVANARLSRRLR